MHHVYISTFHCLLRLYTLAYHIKEFTALSTSQGCALFKLLWLSQRDDLILELTSSFNNAASRLVNGVQRRMEGRQGVCLQKLPSSRHQTAGRPGSSMVLDVKLLILSSSFPVAPTLTAVMHVFHGTLFFLESLQLINISGKYRMPMPEVL